MTNIGGFAGKPFLATVLPAVFLLLAIEGQR